ncbi:MAG: DUF5908 family protein [Kofleriaceae bacterium]
MTIEIKQLIIRAVVDERRAHDPSGGTPDGRAAPVPGVASHHAPPGAAEPDREAMIAECTRRVLRELQRRRGR